MSTNKESGHQKNTANFDHLINVLNGFGSNYNPGNAAIAIPQLQTALTNAQNILATEKTGFTNWKSLSNDRQIAFEPLRALCTRLLNTLISCNPPVQTVDDFKTLNRKIQGARAKALPKQTSEDQNQNTNDQQTVPLPKHISVSQRSYDNQIEFFNKIIVLLASLPYYATNEPELTVTSLQTLLANLKSADQNAYNARVALDNTRIARNKILYWEITGVLDLAKTAKAFVKGKFGIDSPEFALVSSIKFVRIVKKV